MKRLIKIFSLLMAISIAVIALAACSDKDNPPSAEFSIAVQCETVARYDRNAFIVSADNLPDGAGTVYYDTVYDEAMTGIVTAEITFSIAKENNQFINLLFFNDSANSPASCYAVAASGYIQHSPGAGKWVNQQYNGTDIVLQKNTDTEQFVYTIKVVFDFENKVSYLFLSGDKIKLGTEEVTLPENGLYITSNGFRGVNVSATKLRIGIDNKTGVDFTVKSLNVYKSAAPIFATELSVDNDELTLTDGKASATVGYTAVNGKAVITCEGATVNGNTVEFTSAGVYTVKVTLVDENNFTATTKTVTVTVTE